MGKAKLFGGAGILIGAILMVGVFLTVNKIGMTFMKFLGTIAEIYTFTLGIVAVLLGLLLLVYG